MTAHCLPSWTAAAHNQKMLDEAQRMLDSKYTDVRTNQQLVNTRGNKVSNVRPDVQGTNPVTGKRDVIEIQSPSQNNDFMNKKDRNIKKYTWRRCRNCHMEVNNRMITPEECKRLMNLSHEEIEQCLKDKKSLDLISYLNSNSVKIAEVSISILAKREDFCKIVEAVLEKKLLMCKIC